MHHDITRINALLARAGAPAAGRVDWFESIDSTNTWLMKRPDAHARVCIAEWQSAGRGRRGRVWRAPPSSAVLLSIGWDLASAGAAAAGIAGTGVSLVSGLAVVDALRRLGVDSVALKWPNDIIAGGGKLGGILTELNGGRCVIGMGVNVAATPAESPSPESLSPETPSPGTPSPGTPSPGTPSSQPPDDPPRIDLHALGFSIDRDRLAAELIIAHCDYLRRFCAAGLPAFVGEWNAAHAYRGRAVAVQLPGPGESFHGIARGIDASGALVVDSRPGGARRRIVSAEARVRAVETEAEPVAP